MEYESRYQDRASITESSFTEVAPMNLPQDEEEEPIRRTDPSRFGRTNFYFGKTLGEGAFARVVHAKLKNNDSPEFAIKIMEKAHIQREKKVSFVMTEKQILSTISHPFIIRLYYTFHDEEYLYMCMDLAAGGELSKYIANSKNVNENKGISDAAFDDTTSRFFLSELVEALEYLHTNHIIHMDLKPENVLLTRDGHIKVADFGTALMNVDEAPEYNFVGTAEYVSPEILNMDHAITRSCDLWALGCMLFKMLTGRSPFVADTEYLVFQEIQHYCDGQKPLNYPSSVSEPASNLIQLLLQREPTSRLGAGAPESNNDYASLKSHRYFRGTSWGRLTEQQSPCIPTVADLPDPSSMQDGADDEWMLEGDATPILNIEIAKPSVSHKKVKPSSDKSGKFRSGSGSGKGASRWDQLMHDGESIVHMSITWKRKGLFSKRRQLILTTTPRLLYCDPDTMEVRGEIPWTQDKPVAFVQVAAMNRCVFDLECTSTGRRYHFTEMSENGKQTWASHINAMNQRLHSR